MGRDYFGVAIFTQKEADSNECYAAIVDTRVANENEVIKLFRSRYIGQKLIGVMTSRNSVVELVEEVKKRFTISEFYALPNNAPEEEFTEEEVTLFNYEEKQELLKIKEKSLKK